MLTKPKLYIKKSGSAEVEVSDAVEGLQFLGDTTTPSYLNTYQQNIGVDGQTVVAVNYDKNTVNANFYLRFGDYYDLVNAKREIYRLFGGRNAIRLRTDAEPAIVKYVLPTAFEIAPLEVGSHVAEFTIPFDNPSGVKFSLARSDEIADWAESLQFGMGLPSDLNPSYEFTSSSFTVFNPSDIAIQPYEQRHDLQIKVSFGGSSLKITNNTNGTAWTYNKTAVKTDKIILNGVNTTLNGKPASINTDYGNIDLEVGENSISVTGATDFDIIFSFPFIYLG